MRPPCVNADALGEWYNHPSQLIPLGSSALFLTQIRTPFTLPIGTYLRMSFHVVLGTVLELSHPTLLFFSISSWKRDRERYGWWGPEHLRHGGDQGRPSEIWTKLLSEWCQNPQPSRLRTHRQLPKEALRMHPQTSHIEGEEKLTFFLPSKSHFCSFKNARQKKKKHLV